MLILVFLMHEYMDVIEDKTKVCFLYLIQFSRKNLKEVNTMLKIKSENKQPNNFQDWYIGSLFAYIRSGFREDLL